MLTPYVGQLLLLRSKLASNNILLFLDERDLDALDALEAAGNETLTDQINNDDSSSSSSSDDESSDASGEFGRTEAVSLQNRVRLSTVDNFQGEEAEIVIVSTVRCNNRGSVGFLRIDNRVNVMLSRAKHGMFVLGSAETVRRERRATLANFVLQHLEATNAIGTQALPFLFFVFFFAIVFK